MKIGERAAAITGIGQSAVGRRLSSTGEAGCSARSG